MKAFTIDSQHFARKLEIRCRSIRNDINHLTLEEHNYIGKVSNKTDKTNIF